MKAEIDILEPVRVTRMVIELNQKIQQSNPIDVKLSDQRSIKAAEFKGDENYIIGIGSAENMRGELIWASDWASIENGNYSVVSINPFGESSVQIYNVVGGERQMMSEDEMANSISSISTFL